MLVSSLVCIYICICSKRLFTLLDLCVSSLRRGHANLLCIVPILTDDPRRESKYTYMYTDPSAHRPRRPRHHRSTPRRPRGVFLSRMLCCTLVWLYVVHLFCSCAWMFIVLFSCLYLGCLETSRGLVTEGYRLPPEHTGQVPRNWRACVQNMLKIGTFLFEPAYHTSAVRKEGHSITGHSVCLCLVVLSSLLLHDRAQC